MRHAKALEFSYAWARGLGGRGCSRLLCTLSSPASMMRQTINTNQASGRALWRGLRRI